MTQPETDAEKQRDEACFEAGIKLGALYHQFVGTPLSEGSVSSLEDAMEESVESQRYVEEADVEVDDPELNRFGYSELEGTMLDVEIEVEKDDVAVEAAIEE
ncbi:MAG: dihydroneopterin aldolase family protein, partial [Halobacteria archaeon]|nr:dihydroneopterin aldolase family protein [Halobacteria archaeon]